jgi:hypothetical protein
MLNAEAHSSSLLENRLLPFWTRRVTRIVGQVGAVVLVVGAASVTKTDGVLFVLVGAALVVVYIVTRFKDAGARREGRRAARQLAANLAAGQRPMAVAPAGLSEGGVPLEPGETCVVAGAPVEIVQWYGDPVVLTRPMFFVWGSPLAWSVTAMSFMLHARGNRKRAKKAAPRWRDPERARLWLTDRRFLLLSGRGGRSCPAPGAIPDSKRRWLKSSACPSSSRASCRNLSAQSPKPHNVQRLACVRYS